MVYRVLAGLILLQGALCNEDEALMQRITELESLVALHQEKLLAQQSRLKQHRRNAHRRLQTDELPASIHGATNSTRAYTFNESVAGAMDQMWLIICGALVMFMQAGFAMVEAGTCRAKNAQNILLKNLTDVCMGTLGWWFSGWALAYSGPYKDDLLENGFAGYESWFGSGFLTFNGDGTIEPTLNMANWFFQWTFCSAAATIVSGGVAERVNFLGYCLFSFLMTSFVYPIIVAWTWGYGFLASITRTGFMDFAGSGIAHMTGGVAALVGAAMAGPRKGRFDKDEEESFDPHSLPLVVLGTMILWFGWYGFNCGSTLGLSGGNGAPDIAVAFLAAQVAMNTTIAAASGGISVFMIKYVIKKKYDIAGMCNGILAGLVSITAGCGNVECGSACFIAIIGGAVYFVASESMKTLKVDDPIDAFAVHGAAGAWGVLAAALFDWGRGFDNFHGWSGWSCVPVSNEDASCMKGAAGDGIGANFAQIFFVTLWTVGWSILIFLPLRLTGKLRVSDETQDEGMDAAKHCPVSAYDHGQAAGKGWVYTSKVSPMAASEHLE